MSKALDLAHSAEKDIQYVVAELRIKSKAADEIGLTSLSSCLEGYADILVDVAKKMHDSTGLFVTDGMQCAMSNSANLLRVAMAVATAKDSVPNTSPSPPTP
jgi:hypothetical protein